MVIRRTIFRERSRTSMASASVSVQVAPQKRKVLRISSIFTIAFSIYPPAQDPSLFFWFFF